MLGLEVSAIRHDLVSPDGLETGLSGYDCAFHPSNTNGAGTYYGLFRLYMSPSLTRSAVLKFRLISYPNARNGEHLVYQCLETYIPNNVAKSVSESLYGTMKLSMTALPQFFAKLRAIRVRSVSRQASQVSLSASV